ncbi:hypothetical protein [Candidatus Ichthyocystis sparus]|uniref:hypothetical protein n=1 Tax=Candidatus Ichthyocystis sparus TaxID=1561004 RepID=UPI000B814884|nr:hypothetical protein [Candidatus Ichthyocystis sparus]
MECYLKDLHEESYEHFPDVCELDELVLNEFYNDDFDSDSGRDISVTVKLPGGSSNVLSSIQCSQDILLSSGNKGWTQVFSGEFSWSVTSLGCAIIDAGYLGCGDVTYHTGERDDHTKTGIICSDCCFRIIKQTRCRGAIESKCNNTGLRGRSVESLANVRSLQCAVVLVATIIISIVIFMMILTYALWYHELQPSILHIFDNIMI